MDFAQKTVWCNWLSYAPILYVAICHHYQPFVVAVVVVKPLNVMSAIYMASA